MCVRGRKRKEVREKSIATMRIDREESAGAGRGEWQKKHRETERVAHMRGREK